MGNLTRDPEFKSTQSGLSVASFGIATNRKYKDQDETTFVDVTAFGKTAETIAKYFDRGNPIMLEGRLKLDQWESKEGEKRSKLGVILENFTFVRGGEYRDELDDDDEPADRGSTFPPSGETSDIDDIDSDLPF